MIMAVLSLSWQSILHILPILFVLRFVYNYVYKYILSINDV